MASPISAMDAIHIVKRAVELYDKIHGYPE